MKLETEIRKFIKWAKMQLKITGPIKVRLVSVRKVQNGLFSFGSFNISTEQITIGCKGRHILDIERSLAHEMVHLRQKQIGKLTNQKNAGADTSDIEGEANRIAGILMRRWNRL